MSKDTLPTQSTTLEALLRGEGLDKRNNSKNDEESLLEIQVCSVTQVVRNTVYVCRCWLRAPAKCLKCECSAVSLKTTEGPGIDSEVLRPNWLPRQLAKFFRLTCRAC